jgi:hypothetical protein
MNESFHHKGLLNSTGENNCFLNVTIQALLHLTPFRIELHKRINTNSIKQTNDTILLQSMCNLFIQYQFTDQSVLPPTELRESLSSLSNRFNLGKIADAAEAFEFILDRIHKESNQDCCSENRCLAHQVFGGIMMQQSICNLCRGSSEPTFRDDLLLTFQAAEIISESKKRSSLLLRKGNNIICNSNKQNERSVNNNSKMYDNNSNNINNEDAVKKINNNYEEEKEENLEKIIFFGNILNKCMQVEKKSCPSLEIIENNEKNSNKKNKCSGKANVFFYLLEAPLALVFSIGFILFISSIFF